MAPVSCSRVDPYEWVTRGAIWHYSKAPLPRRAYLSQRGPVYPEAGLATPRRVYLSQGGPVYLKAGPSIPRRAFLFRGGDFCAVAGLYLFFFLHKQSVHITTREREFCIINLLVRIHLINRDDHSGPALRHGTLNPLFQVA